MAVAPDLIKTGANVMKLPFYVVDVAENKLERLILVSFKAGLVPISPTFYEQLLRQYPFAKKLQTQIVST